MIAAPRGFGLVEWQLTAYASRLAAALPQMGPPEGAQPEPGMDRRATARTHDGTRAADEQ